MERSRRPESAAPDPTAWRDHAAPLQGIIIAFERGGVQLVGRAPLAIHDSVVQVPFMALAQLLANILGALDPAHPAHEAMRASMLTATSVVPARPPGERLQ